MNRIPISRPIATKEMIEAAANALANERLVMGESVFKFEEEFARYIGTEHAVSVSSGTDALILAMIALDVRGHDVLTTPFSFVATATSIVHAGGTPLFSDVSNEDYNIDPLAIKTNIDANMYGIMPVDIFGYPAKMDEIAEAAGPNVKDRRGCLPGAWRIVQGREVRRVRRCRLLFFLSHKEHDRRGRRRHDRDERRASSQRTKEAQGLRTRVAVRARCLWIHVEVEHRERRLRPGAASASRRMERAAEVYCS